MNLPAVHSCPTVEGTWRLRQAEVYGQALVKQKYMQLQASVGEGLESSQSTRGLDDFLSRARAAPSAGSNRRSRREEAKKKLRKYESKLRHASCPRKRKTYTDKIQYWSKEKEKRRRRWRGGRR